MKKKLLCAWCFYSISLLGIPENAQDYHLYFWAQYNQSLNTNHDVVDTCYEILFNNNQKDLAYPGYISYLADTKRYNEIVSILPSIKKETFPEETQLLFAQALEAVGKKKEAEELLIELVKKQPTKADIVYYAASVYARNNEVKKALNIIDAYLENAHDTSKHFLFYFFKAQLFAQVDNKESVVNMLKKAIELNPNFQQAWLLLGIAYQEQGNEQKALETYQQAEQHLGTNLGIQRQLMALQAKQYFANTQKQKTSFDQAVKLFKQNKYKESLQAINQCLSYGPHEPSKVIKIELLCRLDNYKEALSWITQWIQADPKQTKWFDILEALHKAGVDNKQIKESLVAIAQAKAEYYFPNYYLGGWYINAQDYSQALSYLKKALSITEDKGKQQQVSLLMMLCYERTKQWHELYQFATQALDDIGPNSTFLAYQSLALAKDKKEYAKAQEIINSVLQQEPGNLLLQDLQSYLLYKTNNFAKAQAILEQLTVKAPSPKLYKRLATIYYQQDNKEQAQKTLGLALMKATDQSKKQKLQKLLDSWDNQ